MAEAREDSIRVEMHSPRSSRIFGSVQGPRDPPNMEADSTPVSRQELKDLKEDILQSISALVDSKFNNNDSSPKVIVDQNNTSQR